MKRQKRTFPKPKTNPIFDIKTFDPKIQIYTKHKGTINTIINNKIITKITFNDYEKTKNKIITSSYK